MNTATLAIKHMEMCLLGSCSQLQLMPLGPGWDCQPLGWLPWGTDLSVPALNPMSKSVSRHAWVGCSEKATQTQMHQHPYSSPGCMGVPWAASTDSGSMLEHDWLLAPATLPCGATQSPGPGWQTSWLCRIWVPSTPGRLCYLCAEHRVRGKLL